MIKDEKIYLENPLTLDSILYKAYKIDQNSCNNKIFIEPIVKYLEYNTLNSYPDMSIIPFSGWSIEEIKINDLVNNLCCGINNIYISGVIKNNSFLSTYIFTRKDCFEQEKGTY